MRLLHTTKLKVEEFVETNVKSYTYAILSHTWGDEEVTFQDMQGELPRHMKGFSKLENSCIQANKDGYEYIWIDTCCIDKSSSAELSEAINSMYRWYEEATLCYAYLSDVPSLDVEDPKQANSNFTKSRWFTRGWTLQELIAPRELLFYCDSWSKLGTRRELIDQLTEVTKIGRGMLLSGKEHQANYSIAQRMSWAAKRVTTRLEDRAYSLLGLFDVNMPLLYGEGKKAFIRLQEEILKQTDDESLFAHQKPQGKTIEQESGLLLAESLDYFSQSGNAFLHDRVPLLHGSLGNVDNAPSLVTNKGIQVYSFGCPCTYKTRYGEKSGWTHNGWLMILNCQRQNDALTRPAIFLKSLSSGANEFARFGFGTLLMVRLMHGKPTLDRWTDEPRFQRGIGYDKELKPQQFIPDFENIHARTIFVKANNTKNSGNNGLTVMVGDIIQPSSRKFRLVGGSGNWNANKSRLGWNFGGGNRSTVFGQLMFQELETGEKFVLVVNLTVVVPAEKDPSTEVEFQYQTWCTIIELDRNTPAPSLSQGYTEPFGDLQIRVFENKEFVAISAMDGGFMVRAILLEKIYLKELGLL